MKGIADLLDSDMEDSTHFVDENSILSSASDATAKAPTKRGKKRHRVTMPAKSQAKVRKPAQTKRAPSKKTSAAKQKALDAHMDVEEDAEGDLGAEQLAGPPKAKKASQTGKTSASATATEADALEPELMEVEDSGSPVAVRSMHAASRTNRGTSKVTGRASASNKTKEPRSYPEAQIEDSTREPEASAPARPMPVIRESCRTRQDPPFRRRAGSASDTERGDPSLRRKLGDVTRKFENVDLKYRNLKEVGINEANANMEKLRRQCDATVQASNDLIASLKKELAAQAPLAQDARKLKMQMQSQEADINRARETAAELSSSLSAAQNEIKALQAKLAAARASSVDTVNAKTPGSAIKNAGPRLIPHATAESAQAAQTAQMKEDLYSDLTGLIIRGVKKTEEGDTYDCIQTGRNGTLHFKLYVDQEDARNTSFEETEFLYTPLLDANRDRDMMELMPSYLTEDITFARQNAAKFYGRVVDTLTKKRTEE